MRQTFAAVLWLLLIGTIASAATVFGTIYSENIQPARAVIQINTTPQQQVITPDGTYSFSLAPGAYRLAAVAANASAEKTVIIQGDGEFRIDLILLPGVPEEDAALADLLDVPDVSTPADSPQSADYSGPAAIVLALLLVAAVIYGQRHRFARTASHAPDTPPLPPASPSVSTRVLTADQQKVMQALSSFGNRASQKDLRKALGQWSEAKVSMELTELEDIGVIQKIKKGRGNVIRRA
ncbi:hypothetical protein HYV43_03400 [Candidatus Micrarchaeota archaeon]|nr:hypothetical protein [Candidatus Micrarchaeota archaeon]